MGIYGFDGEGGENFFGWKNYVMFDDVSVNGFLDVFRMYDK